MLHSVYKFFRSLTCDDKEGKSNMSSKDNPLKEEGVVLPEARWPIIGVTSRRNNDGTVTLFPKTIVNFFNYDLETLRAHLTPNEVTLLEGVLKDEDNRVQKAIDDHHKRWPSMSPLTLKRAREAVMTELYSDFSNDMLLFVAHRSLEETQTVAALRLNLNAKHKNICVAESLPARVDISVSSTIDLCRGKTPLALRQILAKVHEFYTKWASFQINLDRLEHESQRDFLSCDYELILKICDHSEDASEWILPTKTMLQEWGYEPKGVKFWGQPVDESKLIICTMNG